MSQHARRVAVVVVAILLICSCPVAAEPGQPVAVRWWGQGFVTIETFWNLRIAIDPYALSIGYDDPGVEADCILITHEHMDHNNLELIHGNALIVRGLDLDGGVLAVDRYLDRAPNEPRPRLFDADDARTPSPNAVRIRTIASWHDAVEGARRGPNAMFVIDVDGVRILHCGDLGVPALTAEELSAIGRVDVLLIPVGGPDGGGYTIDGKQAAAITEQIKPAVVVPIHYWTPSLKLVLEDERPFLRALPERYEWRTPPSNTLAVRAPGPEESPAPAAVVLEHRPRPMPEEMAALFDAKDDAGRASQEVFRPLSVAQMNHRPSDGTHTPRWNVEHMTGRELGFFSQIYHALDAAVPVMDENPKQMPDDYEPAHPDWTGAEEARRIERVQAFTRRFAYLLHEADLDEKPPGHRWWMLRGLLEQMQRHYGEHTANVKKKFDLPDWPAD